MDAKERLIGELRVSAMKFYQLYQEIEETVGKLSFILRDLNLTDAAKIYNTLKYLKDLADEVAKFHGRDGDQVARLIHDIMVDTEQDATVIEGFKFEPDTRDCFSVKKDDKEAFIQWMKGHEDSRELVSEEVHHKTLEKYCNQRLESGEPLPEGVNHYPKPTVKRRKVRS